MLYEDVWVDFDETYTAKRIEEATKNQSSGFVMLNAMYGVDLKQKMQVDIQTRSRYRPIRRIEGKNPNPTPIWYYRKYKRANYDSEFKLDEFAPMAPEDSKRLEVEFNKDANDREVIVVGPRKQFKADVTNMVQSNKLYEDRKRELIRIV